MYMDWTAVEIKGPWIQVGSSEDILEDPINVEVIYLSPEIVTNVYLHCLWLQGPFVSSWKSGRAKSLRNEWNNASVNEAT